MDISFAKLERPPLRARFAPVFWEPLQGSLERITVIIAIEPDVQSTQYLSPAAHVVLPSKRLRAMFGSARAESAVGILREVEAFMTKRLATGLSLEEIDAPFAGFIVGDARTVRGFSTDQMISAAVQMVSAMGAPDEIIEDATAVSGRLTTPTTREFLQRVQSAFVGDDKDRRGRFAKSVVDYKTLTDVTVDYAHHKWLVQFASLPATPKQANNMAREAESKLLELLSARQFIEAATHPILMINRQSLSLADPEAIKLARQVCDRFFRLAKLHGIEPVPVDDRDQAVQWLESYQ